jgi:hypothetical protein
LRKSEIERMQRRLFTERSHAERHGDILRRFGRLPHRNAILALHEAGRKAQKVTRIVEAERLQRQCCNRVGRPHAPAARLPVYAPLTRTASFLRA